MTCTGINFILHKRYAAYSHGHKPLIEWSSKSPEGNITRHPAYRHYLQAFPGADQVMKARWMFPACSGDLGDPYPPTMISRDSTGMGNQWYGMITMVSNIIYYVNHVDFQMIKVTMGYRMKTMVIIKLSSEQWITMVTLISSESKQLHRMTRVVKFQSIIVQSLWSIVKNGNMHV